MPRPEGRDSADMKSHILRGLVKLPPMAQVILKAQEVIAHPHFRRLRSTGSGSIIIPPARPDVNWLMWPM
jgi:hypothetical protein